MATDTVGARVAANIRAAREAQNLSQEALAELVNQQDHELRFTQTTIWKIENGSRALSITEAVALAAALGDARGSRGWMNLAAPPRERQLRLAVARAIEHVVDAHGRIADATRDYIDATDALAGLIASAKEALPDWNTDDDEMARGFMQDPPEFIALEARVRWTPRDTDGQADEEADRMRTQLSRFAKRAGWAWRPPHITTERPEASR